MDEMVKCCPYYDEGCCNFTEYHCCKCDMKCDVGETIRNLKEQGYSRNVGEQEQEVIVFEIRIDSIG